MEPTQLNNAVLRSCTSSYAGADGIISHPFKQDSRLSKETKCESLSKQVSMLLKHVYAYVFAYHVFFRH